MKVSAFLFAFLLLTVPALAQEDDLVKAIQSVPEEESVKTDDIGAPEINPDLELKDTKMREYEDAPILRLRILDKVRAESRTYELNVGRTVAYGNLRIRPRACRRSSPLDEPESASFLQVWEVKPDQSSAWVFSGWMFASSPSLSGMDHPVYDVTVLECKLPEPVKEPEGEAPADDAQENIEPDAEAPDDQVEEPASSTTGDDESTNDTPATPSAPESNE